ncbi:hypothetical protein [Lysinibacillus irui]|uniref:Uncharacterized protein n=1 Tax=Lysinibacillus irui TaxID=2998077 RepID=A0AAJ5S0B1_9BACI|nr:hypothetical protein [Lysinibacillus irui]WDV09379.1 hypothetical protein OU989_22950 [Lysinibacillus irui]
MNKRQRKKNQKKYLPIHADEFNLLTMTEDEQKKAWSEYLEFREKHAYCKTYRQLKEFKKANKGMIFYQFSIGNQMGKFLREVSNFGRKKSEHSITITQSLTENEKQMLKKI